MAVPTPGNISKEMDKSQPEKLLPINEIDSENEHSMAQNQLNRSVIVAENVFNLI